MSKTTAVILAAGQGTRMKSALPKVMHPLAGRPLVHYPVRAAIDAGCTEVIVVVGHGRDLVTRYLETAFSNHHVRTVVQETQKGTGDAARYGVDVIAHDGRVLVFYGDVPLLEAADVAKVLAVAGNALATCVVEDATGYGRIIRDANREVVEIREHKDLRTDEERAVREINPGIFATSVAFMKDALAKLQPNNAQGELYLTDVVSYAAKHHDRFHTVDSRAAVLVGINDRVQLHEAEDVMLRRIADAHRRSGVTVRADARIEDGVEIGADSVIDQGVVLRGATKVGAGVRIDVGCVLTDVVVEDGVTLKPYSVLEKSVVRARAQIGPFSHLRPDSDIGADAHVGNFVETKKTKMAAGAKANHLAYLGDGIIGARANVGAGTIFCNYDGVQKHTTTIEDDAFIGSDSQLVAPVTIGKGAYVATGTTITKDVPADALAIARLPQSNKDGYAAKLKARFLAAKTAKK